MAFAAFYFSVHLTFVMMMKMVGTMMILSKNLLGKIMMIMMMMVLC